MTVSLDYIYVYINQIHTERERERERVELSWHCTGIELLFFDPAFDAEIINLSPMYQQKKIGPF